ncbi:MAG: hypothetical protein ACI9FJ_001889 [Alteromonadaceae bacterium]|jgi:hypothetical protein
MVTMDIFLLSTLTTLPNARSVTITCSSRCDSGYPFDSSLAVANQLKEMVCGPFECKTKSKRRNDG